MRRLVFQDWYLDYPLQQQSVLNLACRGPDGVAKCHPCKRLVCMYRASVLNAAYLGRPMRIGEGDDTTFMSLLGFDDDAIWNATVDMFFDSVDSIPHHYYLHLLHGAEIIGYKHPHELFRERWLGVYLKGCKDMHLEPESLATLDDRLSDWHQQHWN
jgi:hypothetical protein